MIYQKDIFNAIPLSPESRTSSLSNFKYIKIDSDFISGNKKIDNFFEKRQKMNELFDMLNEIWFEDFLSDVDEFKNLILKNCFITNEQLLLLTSNKLTKAVVSTNESLIDHLKTCSLCSVSKSKVNNFINI